MELISSRSDRMLAGIMEKNNTEQNDRLSEVFQQISSLFEEGNVLEAKKKLHRLKTMPGTQAKETVRACEKLFETDPLAIVLGLAVLASIALLAITLFH
jgi:hypothetical protein